MAEHNLPLLILRVKQLAAYLSISRSSVYDRISPKSPRFDPTFPKPFKIGKATCFLQSEVIAFIESKTGANRDAKSH